jgi:hypothetical protein
LGKIPVLVLDDETPLFDSRVIVEYIDNVTPNNKLFPAPNRERTEVKRWEALADGICDAAVAALLEGKRPATPEGADWIARQRDKVARSLEFMAEALTRASAWAPTSRWPIWPWAPHSATCASASRTSPGRKPPQPGQVRQADAAPGVRRYRSARLKNQGRQRRHSSPRSGLTADDPPPRQTRLS